MPTESDKSSVIEKTKSQCEANLKTVYNAFLCIGSTLSTILTKKINCGLFRLNSSQ